MTGITHALEGELTKSRQTPALPRRRPTAMGNSRRSHVKFKLLSSNSASCFFTCGDTASQTASRCLEPDPPRPQADEAQGNKSILWRGLLLRLLVLLLLLLLLLRLLRSLLSSLKLLLLLALHLLRARETPEAFCL